MYAFSKFLYYKLDAFLDLSQVVSDRIVSPSRHYEGFDCFDAAHVCCNIDHCSREERYALFIRVMVEADAVHVLIVKLMLKFTFQVYNLLKLPDQFCQVCKY